MRVIFAEEVLADEASWKHLDRIIHRIDEGAHEWDVQDPYGLEESRWLCEGRPYIKNLFEKAAVSSAYPTRTMHLRRVLVTMASHEAGDLALSPLQAADYLGEPLAILVENRNTDAWFCKSVLKKFGPPELLDHLDDDRMIRFDTGGGIGELPRLIDYYIDKSNKQKHPVRAIVLADSDATMPGTMSANAQRVERKCMNGQVRCMILQKRSIENYIPNEILLAWGTRSDQVAALLRLTPAQRDHFSIKKRFGDSLKEDFFFQFYRSVPENDRDVLKNGFGDKIIEWLQNFEMSATAADFDRRDGAGELRRLVAMIVEEI
ncbi:MAG: hypothetical protein HQM03_05265 [Magnetococcales bacterium]|nr:hypothetical protein [Magnetococcales bacterium]